MTQNHLFKIVLLSCAVVLLFFSSQALAGTIILNQYVANVGFEASSTWQHSSSLGDWNDFAPGWLINGSGGDYRPALVSPPITPKFGLNVGWSNGDYLYQQALFYSIVANTDYALEYWAGKRTDIAGGKGRIVVTAGPGAYTEGVNMWTRNFSTLSVTPGWYRELLRFNTGAASATTTLWLANDGGGQVDFDATVPASVPEPSLVLLLGLGLGAVSLIAWRWKI